jgi:hypothetical protein
VIAILVQEDDLGNARRAAEGQFVRQSGLVVAINESKFDQPAVLGEPIQDRTLRGAIAAPSSRHAQQVHPPREPGQQLPMGFRERNLFQDLPPAMTVGGIAVRGKKPIVRQTTVKARLKVKHGQPSRRGAQSRPRVPVGAPYFRPDLDLARFFGADFFLEGLATAAAADLRDFPPKALDQLVAYAWFAPVLVIVT